MNFFCCSQDKNCYGMKQFCQSVPGVALSSLQMDEKRCPFLLLLLGCSSCFFFQKVRTHTAIESKCTSKHFYFFTVVKNIRKLIYKSWRRGNKFRSNIRLIEQTLENGIVCQIVTNRFLFRFKFRFLRLHLLCSTKNRVLTK